jgi:hypothetical protein
MASLSTKEIDCIANSVYNSYVNIGMACEIPHDMLIEYKNLPTNVECMKKMLTDWNCDGARETLFTVLLSCGENWTILNHQRTFYPVSVRNNDYSLARSIDWLKLNSMGMARSNLNNKYWYAFGLGLVELENYSKENDDDDKYLHTCASIVAHKNTNTYWYVNILANFKADIRKKALALSEKLI